MKMSTEFFPQRPKARPIIYAYSDVHFPSYLKVGYTSRPIEERMKEHYPTLLPKRPWKVEMIESAMYADGSNFRDHAVHDVLKKKGFPRISDENDKDTEWFCCTVNDVRAAVLAVKNHTANVENRVNSFSMRPEQQQAVEKTAAYFQSAYTENSTRYPKFLWNCKMRFGKTFASYQLAKKMGLKKILILTFKPAVVSAWQEDLNSHIDFEGWQFISRNTELTYETADTSRPIVCFGSFQDYLGVNRETGGIKAKNEWVHSTNWDLVIFDEYHFGAWKENAKKLFELEDEDSYDSEDMDKYDRGNAYDETFLPITTMYYLYLSGTPFRALNSGEFIEEQIYNWTYSDEQRAKENWQGEENPYASLPRMVLMTYRIPESIRHIAEQGEYDEFDLNIFFSAKGTKENAKFVYKSEVQKWLDLIRGAYLETTIDDLKLGTQKPAMPYADTRLLNVLQHTLWFLPNVAACYAMKNLLIQKQNTFYHDYTINVCAGSEAGVGAAALEPVQKSMRDPLASKTITLSCGKLTTGVTVKPWTGIFMLRNLSSPETYFQAAFRVQSPWEITTDNGQKEIVKKECYVFDFALNRALKQISDYSCRLNIDEGNPEKKVAEFISFLPVIAYDGSVMKQINAGEILDIAMAGTSATLLAKRWESALLVNVDNNTLSRLMANPAAMEALMKIEGFRRLNEDIQTIINKSEAVKKVKKEGTDNLTPKEKKALSEEEKEYKSKRKQIQEKLIKFATRIPVFMYLTDYREQCLKDVITQLEPGLFKKVTGLEIKDFELLVSLGVFNDTLMNDAVYKFKRYEDASLSYAGINRHEKENRGGWDTVITDDDYNKMFALQQASMEALQIPPKSKPENILPTFTKHVSEFEKVKKKPASIKTTEDTVANGETGKFNYLNTPAPKFNLQKQIDYSNVTIGCQLKHKAFGIGTVKEITDGTIIIVFGNLEKKFQFPGALQQGFLSTSL